MDSNEALPPDEHAPNFYIGKHEEERVDPVQPVQLSQAQELGYDFLASPITTTAFRSRVLKQLGEHLDTLREAADSAAFALPTISPPTPVDTTLTPNAANSSLVAVVSPWIDLGCPDPVIAHVSRQVLNLEVACASFCGISNIMLYGPQDSSQAVGFARAVREVLGFSPYLQAHILLAMNGDLEMDIGDGVHLSELSRYNDFDSHDDISAQPEPFGVWELWNTIRSVCDYIPRLSIALEVPRQPPLSRVESRWYSEPVRLLVLPPTCFLRNTKRFPVFSKSHQQLLSRFARLRFPPWLLLSNIDAFAESSAAALSPASEPTPAEAASLTATRPKDPVLHLQYLRHLQQTQPPRPPIERFGQGYQDYLQSPLQPLTDNLESITYEVFEKDPIKYEWYELAIAAALKDLAKTIAHTRKIVVAVVGAGRGPLVTRVLRASQSTGTTVQCWAVEKNPNAFVLLQRHNATDPLWNGQVNVVKSDMRYWPGPVQDGITDKVDILISELLGSFADNELSPECLDGVQHVLHPDHGINIPQSYSAHLTPLHTPTLHADLLSRTGEDKWELPYVVMLHQYDYLCVQPEITASALLPDVQQAWSFAHPVPPAVLQQSHKRAGGSTGIGGWVGGNGSNEHNSRECSLRFTSQTGGVCHGLAGYFETVLYSSSDRREKIELSTNPVTMESKSKDMISWFPIFFPLKTPLYIPAQSMIEVHMWRQTDDRAVWYEWLVEVWEEGGVDGDDAKKKGRKGKKLGMSELHSSRRNGCLM